MRKILVLAAAVATVSSPALAGDFFNFSDTQGYGTLGYNYLDKARTGSVQARLGLDLNRYLAVEAEYGLGVQGNDRNIDGISVRTTQPSEAAGYVVGKWPVSDDFKLFARGGYGRTSIQENIEGTKYSVGGDHWSYGLGGEYAFTERDGVRADWTRREFKGDKDNLNSYGISYVRHF